MTIPGMVLSQPEMATMASNILPQATSSIESAIISRPTSEVFMPSAPMVIQSEIDTVLNSIGVPPAARIPSFTLAASLRTLKLQGRSQSRCLPLR